MKTMEDVFTTSASRQKIIELLVGSRQQIVTQSPLGAAYGLGAAALLVPDEYELVEMIEDALVKLVLNKPDEAVEILSRAIERLLPEQAAMETEAL